MSSVPNLMCEQASGSPPATLPCAVCRTQSRCEAGFADIRLFRCPQCQHCFTDLGSLEREEQYRVQYFDEDHSCATFGKETRVCSSLESICHRMNTAMESSFFVEIS